MLHVLERLVLQFAEADDHVRDLDTGVVDVVLRLDRGAAEMQHPHQRVAERGVAQVTHVGRLVRIDCRVLDNRFASRGGNAGRPAGCPSIRNEGRSRNRFR